MSELRSALNRFAREYPVTNKGPLSVGLAVTRQARDMAFPLDPELLLTEKRGQVRGLGKAGVQRILSDHGVSRVLAEEGGRTSRGSIDRMRQCVVFLNELHARELLDLKAIEAWWVDRVRAFFAARPFVLKYDASRSLRFIVRSVLEQARSRQSENPGQTTLGTVLQHLVGAKLTVLLPEEPVDLHGASVADEADSRPGDFVVGDVAIHVTTAPGEALLRKCKRNLNGGFRPLLITLDKGATVAEGLAEREGLAGRVDIFDAEQFLAGNLYEIGRFAPEGRRATAADLVEAYNRIVDACETDPGLRIHFGG